MDAWKSHVAHTWLPDCRFEWVDGALTQAIQTGKWVLLDSANLCNPTVLDRLNPMLEPGGQLYLNECGTVNGQPRVIQPHPDFRLFLALDPRYCLAVLSCAYSLMGKPLAYGGHVNVGAICNMLQCRQAGACTHHTKQPDCRWCGSCLLINIFTQIASQFSTVQELNTRLPGRGPGFKSWVGLNGLSLSFISLGADTAQQAISQGGKARMQVKSFAFDHFDIVSA